MVKVQTPDTVTGYHTTREEREFSEDGSTMTLRFQSISNGLSKMVDPMDFKICANCLFRINTMQMMSKLISNVLSIYLCLSPD